MSDDTNGQPQFVTHNEFTAFAKESGRRFNEIMEALGMLRDRTSQGTNWGVIFAGLGVLFALQTLYVQPVKESNANLRKSVIALQEDATKHRENIARLDERSKFVQIELFGETVSKFQGE